MVHRSCPTKAVDVLPVTMEICYWLYFSKASQNVVLEIACICVATEVPQQNESW